MNDRTRQMQDEIPAAAHAQLDALQAQIEGGWTLRRACARSS